MRIRRALLATVFALSVHASQAEAFGRIVFDPTNYHANLLTQLNTLQTTLNQLRQLQYELQSLTNQALNLLPNNDLGPVVKIGEALRTANNLMGRFQAHAWTIDRAQQQFQATFQPTAPEDATMLEDINRQHEQYNQLMDSYNGTVATQAQIVGNMGTVFGTLSNILAGSHSAAGVLQALQAGTQASAFNSAQLMNLQMMMAERIRAETLRDAHYAQATERARARRQKFGTGLASTPVVPDPTYHHDRTPSIVWNEPAPADMIGGSGWQQPTSADIVWNSPRASTGLIPADQAPAGTGDAQ